MRLDQSQGTSKNCSDGAGGAFVAFWDQRNRDDTGIDIYAQRIDSSGTRLWLPNGIPVGRDPNGELHHDIVPDGHGGAIVAWDVVDGSVLIQRLDSTGLSLWTAGGIILSTTPADGSYPHLLADGGGAYVTWADDRGTDEDIYAQRIDPAGNLLWTAGGLPVAVEFGLQSHPKLTTDGAGGAFICWVDNRFPVEASDIFIHRLNPAGSTYWRNNGLPVCVTLGDQANLYVGPNMVSDGTGGTIISWGDTRNDEGDVYAAHVDGLATGVRESVPSAATITLYQNAPNPSGAVTRIRFELSRETAVILDVFDVSGRRVVSHQLGLRNAGRQEFLFKGLNSENTPLPSGIYLYRLRTRLSAVTGKLSIQR